MGGPDAGKEPDEGEPVMCYSQQFRPAEQQSSSIESRNWLSRMAGPSLALCSLSFMTATAWADEPRETRERTEQSLRAFDKQFDQVAKTLRAFDQRAAQDDVRLDELTALVKRLAVRVERLQDEVAQLRTPGGTRPESGRRRANLEAEERERQALREREERERQTLREREERENSERTAVERKTRERGPRDNN
jgi:hypothetical protein